MKLPPVISRFTSARTLKSLSVLMGGTMLTSVISVLSAPLTARVFRPEHFGTWAFIMAASTLAGVVAFSHFPHLIILEKENERAKSALYLSLFTNFMVTVGALVITGALAAGTFFNWWTADYRILWVPFFTFFNGIITILLTWSNRFSFYKTISLNRLLQVIVPVALQLSIGFFIVASADVILVCQFAGVVVCSALLIYIYRNDVRGFAVDRPVFRQMAAANKGLFLVSLPTDLINNFSNQLPVFFLRKFSGEAAVGLYNMSNRLFSLPVSFITTSLSEIFRQKAAEQYNHQGSCRRLVVKTALTLFAVTIVPFIVCMIYATDIFAFVFGETWREAGEYARLVGILFFFKTVMSPVSYVIIIARKYYISLVMDIIVMTASIAAIFIGFYVFKSVHTALLLYACSYAALYFATFYLSYLYALNKNFHHAETPV